jgi:hypothetical protein
MRIVGALIAQAFSFYTTLAFVALLTKPGSDPQRWAVTVGLALGGEVLLFVMKEESWRAGCASKGVGILGFVGDGFINAGGLGALALGILTFGPSALMLGVLEVDVTDPGTTVLATGAISFVLGLALSITPHILWRTTRPRAAAKA